MTFIISIVLLAVWINMREFSITLLSNSCTGLYDNTLSSFTNLLNSIITLDDNWIVGLSEIYVNDLNYKERIRRDALCEYPTLEGYTQELTKIKTLMSDFMVSSEPTNEGGKPEKRNTDLPNLFEYIDSIFHPIKTLTEMIVEQANDVKEMHVNNNDIADLAFIYTDIIQPRYLGNLKSRVLKIIPLKNNKGFYAFKNIEYFPLQTNILKDISILITSGSGENINFKPSNIPTVCTLHFKNNI